MRVKCEARVDSSFTPGHKVNVFIYQNPDLIASPSSGYCPVRYLAMLSGASTVFFL